MSVPRRSARPLKGTRVCVPEERARPDEARLTKRARGKRAQRGGETCTLLQWPEWEPLGSERKAHPKWGREKLRATTEAGLRVGRRREGLLF